MSTTTVSVTKAATRKLAIRSYNESGIAYYDVSTRPARDCRPDEMPVIDLGRMYGDSSTRKALAKEIVSAAEKYGFFYISNHGIPKEAINAALEQADKFFHSPLEVKQRRERPEDSESKYGYGYHKMYSRRVDPTKKDRKEGLVMHYEPRFDPMHKAHLDTVPEEVISHLPNDPYTWTPLPTLPDFDTAILTYYTYQLNLARQLIRILALGLDLPENYFDKVTAYPGGDCAINYYPGDDGKGPYLAADAEKELGLGAHTDLQVLTLLWQDEHRGLQVLNTKNEWINAKHIPGTLVVNIGDFLMRLTNDRLKSTVHRVVGHGKGDRYSMPFFFGFNFNEKCGVVPTCVSENNPAKYEPATCGELITRRLASAQDLKK